MIPVLKGGRVSEQVRRQLANAGAQVVESQGKTMIKKLSQEVDQLLLTNPTVRNQITYHLSAEASQKAILDAVEGAKKSFHIETFIWHNDTAGHELLDALTKKKATAKAAGQEFDVKVLIDSIGLRGGSGGSKDTVIVDKLKQAGIDVREFNAKYVSWEAKGIPITHRKLYIADGEKFITGGRNIGNEYLKPQFNGANGLENAWHDLLYTVHGDETARIQKEFYENWARAGGQVPAVMPAAVPHATGTAKVQSIVTDPHAKTFAIREAHSKAIANAEKEIVAIFPYFSDDQLVQDLVNAKRANTAKRAELMKAAQNKWDRAAIDQAVPELSVKVMLPGNKEASREGSMYYHLNQESALQLLKEGVEVRYFDGGKIDGKDVQRFSHFKGMAVDGKLLSLGSANADARTFNANHELNTLISDKKAVKEFFDQVITPDWNSARKASIQELQNVPMKDKLKRKFYEAVDFLL
jgi:cardiolipin synthase